jgi:hypothetical protein
MIETATGVTAAHAGAILTLDGEFGPDVFMLYSSCGGPAPLLACVPCRALLANLGQVEMHLETPGPHAIAAKCTVHGWEAGR